MSQKNTPQEPFGHFKAEAFGWTDCAETDEGAQPLYDQAAIDELGERLMVSDYALKDAERQRDALLKALSSVMTMDVKGQQFQDRLQFSSAGREILEQCNAAIAACKPGSSS